MRLTEKLTSQLLLTTKITFKIYQLKKKDTPFQLLNILKTELGNMPLK